MTGVDFSDVALGFARKQRPDVDWVLADLREYEPERGAFDLVLVLFVHLPPDERRALLARAADALAAGGTAVVSVTTWRTSARARPARPARRCSTPRRTTARELAGLEIVKAGTVTRRVTTDDGAAEAVDTLVVARRS